MQVAIEVNQKYGYGYQVRMIVPPTFNSVQDSEPFSAAVAIAGAQEAVRSYNQANGTSFEPYNVILISKSAQQAMLADPDGKRALEALAHQILGQGLQ